MRWALLSAGSIAAIAWHRDKCRHYSSWRTLCLRTCRHVTVDQWRIDCDGFSVEWVGVKVIETFFSDIRSLKFCSTPSERKSLLVAKRCHYRPVGIGWRSGLMSLVQRNCMNLWHCQRLLMRWWFCMSVPFNFMLGPNLRKITTKVRLVVNYASTEAVSWQQIDRLSLQHQKKVLLVWTFHETLLPLLQLQ